MYNSHVHDVDALVRMLPIARWNPVSVDINDEPAPADQLFGTT